MVSQDKVEEMTKNEEFLREYDIAVDHYESYMNSKDTWFAKNYPNNKEDVIAYFSAEYGLDQTIPIYSGGLGILSGDHLKSASDLGIPLVAVGLLYKNGYFNQKINAYGMQESEYYNLDMYNLPLTTVKDENGELIHDIKMVIIDVTVENPDGANNLGYQDPNGNILPNQYVFTITPIGMVSEEISFQSSTPAYYSLRNSCPEREDGFSVEPGKSVSFQLGYLISNRPDGSEIENSALGLTLEGTKSVWWFNLMLEDEK